MCWRSKPDRVWFPLSLSLQLRCCGVHDYTSWLSSVYFPVGGIPASCCVDFSDCSSAELKNATLAARKVHKQVWKTRDSSRIETTSAFKQMPALTIITIIIKKWIHACDCASAGLLWTGDVLHREQHGDYSRRHLRPRVLSGSNRTKPSTIRYRSRHLSHGRHYLFQLMGMSLACCLSRLINANQYEMVWQVTHARTHARTDLPWLFITSFYFSFSFFRREEARIAMKTWRHTHTDTHSLVFILVPFVLLDWCHFHDIYWRTLVLIRVINTK